MKQVHDEEEERAINADTQQDNTDLQTLQSETRKVLASLRDEENNKQDNEQQLARQRSSAAALAVANFEAETQQEQKNQSRGLSV